MSVVVPVPVRAEFSVGRESSTGEMSPARVTRYQRFEPCFLQRRIREPSAPPWASGCLEGKATSYSIGGSSPCAWLRRGHRTLHGRRATRTAYWRQMMAARLALVNIRASTRAVRGFDRGRAKLQLMAAANPFRATGSRAILQVPHGRKPHES